MARTAAERIERTEPFTLALAAASVGLYLLELSALAEGSAVHAWAWRATLAIDALFAVDLIVKLAVLRGPYLRSPWFAVDLVSTLPVLSWLTHLPHALEGLRFVRAFRLLRALRSLRALRLMRVVAATRRLDPDSVADARRTDRTLVAAVLAYAAIFVGLVIGLHEDPRGELYLVLGSVLGMALVLVVVRPQVQEITRAQVRTLLSAALPPQVADAFLRDPEAHSRTVYMPATVIFCDLQGFTQTVEALGGDMATLKVHLERAMDAVVAVHLRHDLLVDKLIGDAVMSFRGGDLVPGTPEEHAVRAVRASLDSVDALVALGDPYFHRIKVGGASAESAMIGTFGTSDRLSYTILGDRVNLAARLEAACGQLRASTLFDAGTRALTAGAPDLAWRRVGRLKVPGKAEVIEAHEALRAADDLSWLDAWHRAVAAYEAARFEDAMGGFEEVVARRGEDGPSGVYLAACRRLLARGLPEGWDGALEMVK